MTPSLRFTVFVFGLLFAALQESSAFQWEPFQGEFPANAFSVKRGGMSQFFCQGSNGKGESFTGTVSEEDKRCVVANVNEESLEEYDQFEIFTLAPQEKASFKYPSRGQDRPPHNSVRCQDSSIGLDNACYLGHSVYGDGICTEMIGKVSPAASSTIGAAKVTKVFYGTPTKPEVAFEGCPFVTFLTVNSPQNG